MEIFTPIARSQCASDYDFYRALLTQSKKGRRLVENLETGFGLGSMQDFTQSVKEAEQMRHKLKGGKKRR